MPQAYLNAENEGCIYSFPRGFVHPEGYKGFYSNKQFYGHIPSGQGWQQKVVVDHKKFRYRDKSGYWVVMVNSAYAPCIFQFVYEDHPLDFSIMREDDPSTPIDGHVLNKKLDKLYANPRHRKFLGLVGVITDEFILVCPDKDLCKHYWKFIHNLYGKFPVSYITKLNGVSACYELDPETNKPTAVLCSHRNKILEMAEKHHIPAKRVLLPVML